MPILQLGRGSRGWRLELPDRCPICQHLVFIDGAIFSAVFPDDTAELAFRCPNTDCQRLFLGFYKLDEFGKAEFLKFLPHRPGDQELPDTIQEISPSFVAIYKEASEAKEMGLQQIAGPGFRKAFEFLIKDYAKRNAKSDDDRQKIEQTTAGVVVNNYIGDTRIQDVAKRTLWLGNDETHYLRKWTEHDIGDLITLIRLTIHWIEIEHLSKKYVAGMPDEASKNQSGG